MLVLSRKPGQSIRIAPGVTIVVQQISGSKVVLGFEAPRHVRIVRNELPDEAPVTMGMRAAADAGANRSVA